MISLTAILLIAAQGLSPPQEARETPITRVVRATMPAVVNISTTRIVERQSSFFFEPRSYKRNSVGSGAVIHPRGYVLTNAHVIARATELKVIFADKRERPAELVAELTDEDLAVIRVSADPNERFPSVRLGRSDDLMVGETVVAIGNPVGLGHTVTTGIISALDRELNPARGVRFGGIIQTDAAINPGNSGGPLLNILGEQIGVNTAIRSDAQNVGFAIPVERVKDLLPEMLAVEGRGRVSFGLRWRSGIDAAVVDGVRADSPAARGGLRAGDRVLDIAGRATPGLLDAIAALLEQPVEEAFTVTTERAGKLESHVVRIEALPKPDGAKLARSKLGLGLVEMDERRAASYGLRPYQALIVERLGEPAASGGVRRGDLISGIGGYGVASLEEAGYLLEQLSTGDRVRCRVVRVRRGRLVQQDVVIRVR